MKKRASRLTFEEVCRLEDVHKLFEMLPDDLKREVVEYIEFLIENRGIRGRKPTLSWKGALKDIKEKYTSVELQHKALEWWG